MSLKTKPIVSNKACRSQERSLVPFVVQDETPKECKSNNRTTPSAVRLLKASKTTPKSPYYKDIITGNCSSKAREPSKLVQRLRKNRCDPLEIAEMLQEDSQEPAFPRTTTTRVRHPTRMTENFRVERIAEFDDIYSDNADSENEDADLLDDEYIKLFFKDDQDTQEFICQIIKYDPTRPRLTYKVHYVNNSAENPDEWLQLTTESVFTDEHGNCGTYESLNDGSQTRVVENFEDAHKGQGWWDTCMLGKPVVDLEDSTSNNGGSTSTYNMNTDSDSDNAP